MKIRNLTAKPIGFGSVVILPDQTGDTPKGYDRDHPTVKYYLSRKWIAEIGTKGSGGAAVPAGGLSVNVNAGGNPGAGVDDGENGASGENDNGGGTSSDNGASGGDGDNGGTAPGNKSIDRMTKDELQALAFERGVQFIETDTRQVLIDKIKAAKNANE